MCVRVGTPYHQSRTPMVIQYTARSDYREDSRAGEYAPATTPEQDFSHASVSRSEVVIRCLHLSVLDS